MSTLLRLATAGSVDGAGGRWLGRRATIRRLASPGTGSPRTGNAPGAAAGGLPFFSGPFASRRPYSCGVSEFVWTPGPEDVESANVTRLARRLGVDCFSSPFDPTATELGALADDELLSLIRRHKR